MVAWVRLLRAAVSAEPETELACLVARPGGRLVGSSAASIVGDENCPIIVSDILDLEAVDVVIDFHASRVLTG